MADHSSGAELGRFRRLDFKWVNVEIIPLFILLCLLSGQGNCPLHWSKFRCVILCCLCKTEIFLSLIQLNGLKGSQLFRRSHCLFLCQVKTNPLDCNVLPWSGGQLIFSGFSCFWEWNENYFFYILFLCHINSYHRARQIFFYASGWVLWQENVLQVHFAIFRKSNRHVV